MTVVCIAGMHRSGTSMVARLLNICGLYLGEDNKLLGAEPFNEKGHWENTEVLDINETILKKFGGSWDNPPEFPEGWENNKDISNFLERAEKLVEKMNSKSDMWGFKDPRTCLLLPFWKKVLPNMIFVISMRDTIEIALSLNARNGFPVKKSLMIWKIYWLSIIKHTNNEKRIFTSYGNYFADWKSELNKIINFIGIPELTYLEKEKEVINFISPNLYHYHNIETEKSLYEDDSRLPFYLLNQVESITNNLDNTIQQKDSEIQQKNSEIQQKNSEIQQKNSEIQQKNSEIQQKDQEIDYIKSSKFWKIRNDYLKIKNLFLNFFYFKGRSLRRLYSDASTSLKNEGFIIVSQRIINFIFHGKGFYKKYQNVKNDKGEITNIDSVDSDKISVECYSKMSVVPLYLNPYKIINSIKNQSKQPSIAIHLYLHNEDKLPDCVTYFSNIPYVFDLYVSVTNNSDTLQIKNFLECKMKNINKLFIKKVPNRGRDIAHLIIQFGKKLLKYDIFSHIHTFPKRLENGIENCFNETMNLLCGSETEISQIIELLDSKTAKIIYPEENGNAKTDKTGWGSDLELAGSILNNYTKLSINDFPVVEFPQASMFWARTECLINYLSLPLKYSDFLEKPASKDGDFETALQKLVFIFALENSGKCYRIHKKDSIHDYVYYEEQQDFSKRLKHNSVKVLSYYLPQFHPIPENDNWHGKGFTEWHKVRTANPLFCDHFQQHIPHDDIGYYLLDSPEILKKQAEMMKKSGVFGQIFYHYWFSGKLILEKPAQMLLHNKDIEIPFCFCWANENWTKRWDGNEDEILLKQDYSKEDADEFIRYLIPFFKDDRYIKIENRPVIFIYRPSSFPDFSVYREAWSNKCLSQGIKEPYIIATLTRGATSPDIYGMDAAVERVLHDWTEGNVADIRKDLKPYTPLNGSVLDYNDVADFYMNQESSKPFTYFRSIIPIFDNTARYGNDALLVHNFTPKKMQEWMELLIKQTEVRLPENRQFVVVNAWNEWAESAHLEPDTRFGYAYLNSIGRALANISFDNFDHLKQIVVDNDLAIKLEFSVHVTQFLNRKKNRRLKEKFFKCIMNSSIFDICNIVIPDRELFEYLTSCDHNFKIQKDFNSRYDFKIVFGTAAYFATDMIEELIKNGIYNKKSVICGNNFFDYNLEIGQAYENASIDSFDAYDIRLYPANIKEYKNFKICYNAVCATLLNNEHVDTNGLPVVTSIIRFHKNGDFKLLNNALLSLLSQSDCIVRPLIAAQDLSDKQKEDLNRLVHNYPWDNGHQPIIKLYSSNGKNTDLRSKMLNESLQAVDSEYAAFLDYDDTLFPFAYRWLINRLNTTNKAVSFGRVFVSIFSQETMQIKERRRDYERGESYENFLYNNHAPLHSFMLNLKKIDVSNIRYFDDMKYMEDYYLTLQIFNEENVDWESLKLNHYIGDYTHSFDANHTLALTENEKRHDLLKDEHYISCEQRLNELRRPLI